jgi:hypothetical protein
MPIIKDADQDTLSRFQQPIRRLYNAQTVRLADEHIEVGKIAPITIVAPQGVRFGFPRPREESVFAALAPPIPTAFGSTELRNMYQRHFAITLETDEVSGVTSLSPKRGSGIRLFTAHTLFPNPHAMQEFPKPIAVAFGGILSLPEAHLSSAGRRGLVVTDDLEGSRDVAVAIPLLKLVSRGLVPDALQSWWRELFRRSKTLVVLDEENLASSNKRKKVEPILRSMKPVGIVTN